MSPRRGTVALGLTVGALLLLLIAEIAFIIWVSGKIGWWTLALLMATSVLGLFLMQREWRKAWAALSDALRSGQLPTGRMADASLVLVGGILLAVPGLLTDMAGLLLLLPFTRPFVRSAVTWWASRIVTPNDGQTGPTIIKGEATTDPGHGTLIPGLGHEEGEATGGTVIRGDLADDER